MTDQTQVEPQSNVFVPEPFTPSPEMQQQEIPDTLADGPVELEPKPEVKAEQEAAPEVAPEATPEAIPPEPTPSIEVEKNIMAKIPKLTKKKPAKIPQVRDDMTMRIEKIMEEGIDKAFDELTPVQKQEFKIKGEEAALEIRSLMQSAKVKVRQVFSILLDWLKILPGINKFYLEQEAKIKADKIIALKKTR